MAKTRLGRPWAPGALWVPNVGDGTLMRVDPATNRVVATIDLGANHAQVVEGQDLYILMPSAPVAVAASDTAIWVTRNASRSPTERTRDVLRIDPATNAIVATTPLEASPDMLALSEGAVWVISREAGLVLRVDTATNQVVATIAVDQPLSVSVGDGAVWVVSGPTPAVTPLRVVTRIDPATNSVADTFSFQDELLWVAWGDGALWAALPRANEVQRIDPATHAVTARIAVSSPGAIAVDGGAVWVKSGTGSALTTLTRIDAATNTVVATYSTGAPGGTLSVADGAVWVADTLGGRIIRIIP